MRPLPAAMMRVAGAFMLLTLLCSVTAAAADEKVALQRTHQGIALIALSPDPSKRFDTSIVPADRGLRRIAAAFDRLVEDSPLAADATNTLKRQGRVLLVYRPDDLRRTAGVESVATFHPDYRRGIALQERRKTFLVVIGRHGVKWPVRELAAVLAHELLGHGMQQVRGRLSRIRIIDAECEANLYEEIANQDLGLDKRSRKMIAFRQALENHWCADFKSYLRTHRPDAVWIWNALNPNIPELLAVFEDYLEYNDRMGITARAQSAAERQRRLARIVMLKGARPETLFRTATVLRDGGIGVPPDSAEALRYFRLAAHKGHMKARLALGRLKTDLPEMPVAETNAFSLFSRTVLSTAGKSTAGSKTVSVFQRPAE